jgi:ferredoxin
VVQALAFLAFLAYVVSAPALVGRGRTGGIMRLSALSGLGASVSAWQVIWAFWPAAVLLALAVALGRFFCGWLCPLGATLDAGDRLGRWLAGRRPLRRPKDAPDFEHFRGRRLKHYVLAGCLVGAFLGVSVFGLFDPLSIAVRSFVLAVHSYLARGLAALAEAFGSSGGAAAVRAGLVVRSDPVFQLHAVTFAVLVGLLALGLVRRRFWCRYLCPLGALYALAARAALTKRSVSDACIECGRCAEACPTGCISPDGRRTLNDECILCLQCQPVCPTDAIRFLRPAPAEQRKEVDLTRRGALVAAAAGVAAYPLARTAWARPHAKDDPLIRPPLAGRDIGAFLSRCVRCGQCMRVCPTQVIQPAGLEAGIESLWTPKLDPRPGYCEYNCNMCGQACPSGAIPRFGLAEKHATAVGLAFVDVTRCIPWRGYRRRDEAGFVADEHNCGVCEEVCPAPGKAIHFRRVEMDGQELRLPHVIEDACVGCGYCEAVCPVVGEAAIRVTGGFRELPETARETPAVTPTEAALPATAGSLRLAGARTTYTGPEELFSYIDGAGEPYLGFGFVRVTAAEYTDGEHTARVDMWQLATSDDAFGAFAMDRRGEPVEVGDEGAMLGSSLWARRGRFMIAVMDMGGAPREDVLLLARTALEALDEPPAARPALCRRLPREGLDATSVAFLREEGRIFDLALTEGYVPDQTWGFGEGVTAAYGAYDLGGERPAALLLMEHPGPEGATAVAERLAAVRADWGEERVASEPHVAFRTSEGDYGVMGARGRYFAAVFRAPSLDAGADLIRRALENWGRLPISAGGIERPSRPHMGK